MTARNVPEDTDALELSSPTPYSPHSVSPTSSSSSSSLSHPSSLAAHSPASSNTTAVSPPTPVDDHVEEKFGEEEGEDQEEEEEEEEEEGMPSSSTKDIKSKKQDKRGRGRPRTDYNHPRWIPYDQLKTEKDPSERARLMAELKRIDKIDRDAANQRRKAERQVQKELAKATGGKVGPQCSAKAVPKTASKMRGRKELKGKEPAVLGIDYKGKGKGNCLPRCDTFLAISAPCQAPLRSANAEIPVGDMASQDVPEQDTQAAEADGEDAVADWLAEDPVEQEVNALYEEIAREVEANQDAEGDDEEEGDEDVIEDGDLFGPPMPWLEGCKSGPWGWPTKRDDDDEDDWGRGGTGECQFGSFAGVKCSTA